MSSLTRLLLAPLVALLVAGQGSLQAESLRRAWLPADAHWVAHLDVEAIGVSVLGQAAAEWGESQGRLARSIDAFEERYRLHPLEDLFGLTLYGSSGAPDDAVLIAVTSPRLDELLTKLRAHPLHSSQTEGGIEIHTWAGDDLPTSDPPLAWFGTLTRPVLGADGWEPLLESEARVLVLADRVDLLQAAVALVRGASSAPRTLAGAEKALLVADPGPGTTLYLEAGRGLPELLGRLPDSRLARQTRRVRVMLGEHKGRAGARIRIGTGSRENARDVADVLRGGLRVLRLTLGSGGLAPELAARVDDMRVEEKRTDVHISFQGDATQLALELAAVLARLPDESAEEKPAEPASPPGVSDPTSPDDPSGKQSP